MSEIHWLNPTSGSFTNAANWSGGVVPGRSDDAILDAPGGAYTVTVGPSPLSPIETLQTAANATLEIGANQELDVLAGTGSLASGGANRGSIVLDSRGLLAIGGTVNDPGSILVNDGAELLIMTNTSLYGGGVVSLAKGFIQAIDASAVLTNTDNTIVGSGYLGGLSGFYLVNGSKGVIDASATGIPLVLDPGAGVATVANAGLIEATGAAGLTILNAVVDNSAGGAIIAAAGSIVRLQQADIIGGVLGTTGSGIISTDNLGAPQLDGTAFAVSTTGRIDINDGQTLGVEGSITNTGRFVLYGADNPTTLRILPKGATLSGGGSISLIATESEIAGLSSSAVLTNVDNIIFGAGDLGAGSLKLINETNGVIAGTRSTSLVLDTGTNIITNAGRIVAKGAGGVTIQSTVNNSGLLEAAGGVLTVNGAVSGTGAGIVDGGTLDFASSFNQKVVFWATTGILELAQSQSYTGTVFGFSKTGGTSLDLKDIAFVNAGEATYSGTATSGVLTVTDGTHTAKIHLAGDYLASTFTASSDGHGGTIVVDPLKAASMAASHRFVAALAGLGASAGGAILAGESWSVREPVLVKPRAMLA